MSAPPLTEVAGWDVPRLRGAVSTLVTVADRLPSWRARMESVGRSLTDAECWYGPAAQAAGTALVEVSTVATAVTTALTESLEQAHRLLTEADAAQDSAERALAAAAAVPVVLDGTGRLVAIPPLGAAAAGLDADQTAAVWRAQELAAEALDAAARAGLAATAAADALTGPGIGGPSGPATFAALADLVPPPSAPPATLVLNRPPGEVAAWWAGLSTAERETVIERTPVLAGGLEGLPAWARDRANRLRLEEVLADSSAAGHPVAVSVAAELTEREEQGESVQLYELRPSEGLVGLALGDVDTADSVALLVPGILNEPQDDLDDLVENADAVADAARAAEPGLTVAGVAWFGYRPPGVLGAVGTSASREGGRALDRALDGLATARATDPARVVVSAHSYGTTVVEQAAAAPGELAADAVVLNGSPGMNGDAGSLEAAEVYEASAGLDPIGWVDWHGRYPTWDDGFGAIELPTEWVMTHSEYYAEHFPTLAAIGEVVAGPRPPD
ncbi:MULTISPECIES: alpha/beta hydrolase [unclassified Geodermatophilus]|uniref:alpha/beta hydrolase n=1 Tax=unclassified Geodermatophilus TaxID=2637632 RepID=UPI003EEFCE50